MRDAGAVAWRPCIRIACRFRIARAGERLCHVLASAPISNSYGYRHRNSDCHGYIHAQPDAYAHLNGHAHGDGYRNTDAYAHIHLHAYARRNTDAYCDRHRYAY